MTSITYFYRNPKAGYSIGKVFDTITTEISKTHSIQKLHVPSSRALPVDILRNLHFVYKHRNKTGINHITGDIHYCILALIGCKTVLTVHDLVDIKKGNILEKIIKWFLWIFLPVLFTSKITCISKNTETELKKYVKARNTCVIHNPVDPAFKYSSKNFSSKQTIILHIGCGWNKNLSRVIASLKGVNCHLRIIGKLTPAIGEQLKNTQLSYSNGTHLTDEEIVKEYINCDIVSFPSIYEGFGMPIIEGQKTGRPVLTSNIAPLTEIAGDGAYYVNPNSEENIKNGFLRLINDGNLRGQLIKNGVKNAENFTVEKIAKKYIELYNQIIP